MRIYRNGIKLCLLMCSISFIPLILNIFFKWDINYNIENLLLGILASAFVALITYIGAYNIEKRKTIGLINKYCREYILEWSNLIPLLMEIRPDGVCTFNWNEVINKVKYDDSVHNIVVKLCKIHEERLYTVDGYYPLFRRNKNNLNIHNLIIAFAKLNCSVQYCDIAYLLNNNIVCQMEREDISFSDEELKKYLKIILQNQNNEYQDFLKLVKTVSKMGTSKYVFDPKCGRKCS